METGMREDRSSGSNSAADDLDEAIECAREIKTRAVIRPTMPVELLQELQSQGKPACLNQIATLYSYRYKKTNDVANLRSLLLSYRFIYTSSKVSIPYRFEKKAMRVSSTC